jgi:23S rRNA (adenine2503-C2)-methyltransferase
MTNLKELIHDLNFSELEQQLLAMGEPRFRAKQIWTAFYQNYKNAIDEISTLPKPLREKLSEIYNFEPLKTVRTIKSQDGLTKKTLFALHDGALIETVLMIYEDRRTLCISSQSGCSLSCTFCATGQMGFTRNLSQGEIVAQVLNFARDLAGQGERVTNVVVMGMGEPFLNYDQVMGAIARLNDADGFGLGARRITVSTVGIVPRIKQFADANTQINLAISLHTVNDELRSQLLPINKKYPVALLLEACRYYIRQTNRRLTFEYALIDGVNDSIEDAVALAERIKGMLCHVNLIQLNPTQGYDKPGANAEQVRAFCDVLEKHLIPCTVRLRRGIEIGAGCGQLAAESKPDIS